LAWQAGFLVSLPLLHLADHHHLRIYNLHFLLDRRNHLKVEREHSHRFGYHQHNGEIFSLVSQKVMAQPPSADKKKQCEICDVLGTGSFVKAMV